MKQSTKLSAMALAVLTLGTLAGCSSNEVVEEPTETTEIVFSIDHIETTGSGVEVEDTTLKITQAGDYYFSGSLENGMIEILVKDDEQVNLIFEDVSIHNDDGPVLYVENSQQVVMTLVGDNSFSNGNLDVTLEEDVKEHTIFTEDTLVINGEGSLELTSRIGDGINGKDDIIIESGTITIDAYDDGISTEDEFIMEDGLLTIVNSVEGIEGFHVSINGGEVNVVSTDDAINASDPNATSSSPTKIPSSTPDSELPVIYINGGKTTITIPLESVDADGLDSNGHVYLNGGELYINYPSENQAMASIDVDGTIFYNGGSVVTSSTGSVNIDISLETGSMIVLNLDSLVNKEVAIVDPEGTVVMTFIPTQNYQSIRFVSDEIIVNKEYTIVLEGKDSVSFTPTSEITYVNQSGVATSQPTTNRR